MTKIKGKIIDYLLLVFACTVGAYATTAVMIPNDLTSGGLTGIVRIIQYFITADFSILYYGGAFIILIVVIFTIGAKEARKIIVVTIMYPGILFIMERFDLRLLEQKDMILAAIFCGVFSGICNGIVFWRGYSFCGTESVAKIIKKKMLPQVSISRILLLIDTCIVVISAFIYGTNIALYALVTQFIASKLVDFVMYGFETKIVQVNIITTNPKAVSEFVLNSLGRGVSSRKIVGEFTGEEKKELVVLCSPRESMILKKQLVATDPNSFVTILHVDTVWGTGKGFTDIEKEQ